MSVAVRSKNTEAGVDDLEVPDFAFADLIGASHLAATDVEDAADPAELNKEIRQQRPAYAQFAPDRNAVQVGVFEQDAAACLKRSMDLRIENAKLLDEAV